MSCLGWWCCVAYVIHNIITVLCYHAYTHNQHVQMYIILHVHVRRNGVLISLQVDDIALFFPDQYDNYLGFCVDGRTYYLNHICASKFTDAWHDKGVW